MTTNAEAFKAMVKAFYLFEKQHCGKLPFTASAYDSWKKASDNFIDLVGGKFFGEYYSITFNGFDDEEFLKWIDSYESVVR